MIDIDLIKRRIVRAEQLAAELRTEQQRFVDENPQPFYLKEDPDRTRVVVTVKIDEASLDHRSILFSGAVHQLRSALDNMVYALWVRQSGVPRDPRIEKAIGFPVFTDLRRFEERSGYQIRGIPADAQRFVESEQPYHRRHAPEDHPLWILHDLSNLDKHRAPRVVAMALDTVEIGAGPDGTKRFPSPSGPQQALFDGAEVGEFVFERAVPAGTEMDFEFTVLIGVAHRQDPAGVWSLISLDESLSAMINQVTRIVEKLSGSA